MPLNDIPREKEYKLFSVEGRKEGTFVIYRNEATKDIREIKEEQYVAEGKPLRRKFVVE